jgi:hypothetical protein
MIQIIGQPVASTHRDSQGEEYSRDFLEDLCRDQGEKVLLRQHHDFTKPAVGYMENFRVVRDPDHDGHWLMLADVFVEKKEDAVLAGGFSWSKTIDVESNHDEPLIGFYLPWPHYNDRELIEEILGQAAPIKVGKWVRKAAEPVAVLLLVSLGSVLVSPIWNDVYERKVGPWLRDQLHWIKKLRKRDVQTQIVLQLHLRNGQNIQVFMNPEDEFVPTELDLGRGLCKANHFVVNALNENQGTPDKISMYYDSGSGEYEMLSCEYIGGKYVHLVSFES